MPSDPFGLVGQVLDGQFRVERHVGEGGFSIVYRGTHVGLGEPIAIKCLKLPSALGSAVVESFVRRFRDESRLHYKLPQGNLHIARSIASGTTTAPTTSALVPYIVLEWLEGRSLAQDFSERRAHGLRGRSMRDVIALLDSAIDALAYAHAQGVVHRDLNPGNLFLAQTPSGIRLKILDFGVAKVMADSALAMGPTARTVGNMRMFAPAYGAPEQFDDRRGTIGPWTDVYAIGLVVLEALSDRTVREGEHLGEYAAKALDEKNSPTPRRFGVAVGDEVEKVLSFALALDPRQRPRDAGEFWGMLKHAILVDARSGRLPHANPTTEDEPVPATLRMDERISLSGDAGRSSNPPRPHGGTLRLDRAQSRSASELLAATPIRARDSVTPAPPGVSRPSGAPAPPAFSPVPPRVTPLPAPVALPALPAVTPLPPSATVPLVAPTPLQVAMNRPFSAPADRAASRTPAPPPRALPAPRVVVALVLVVVGLAGAAGIGWHAWRARMAVPAERP